MEILDSHSADHMQRAAEMVAAGEVIIIPICGVMGFTCDGSNPSAIDRVFTLKGRNRTQALITAASAGTRERLAALDSLSPAWNRQAIDAMYDLPVLIVFPAGDVPADFIRPDQDRPEVDTVAIWWGNFYLPMALLERSLLALKPGAFLAGTSCNISGRPSITDSRDAYDVFGQESLVAAIVRDTDFDEGRGLLSGSHTMLRLAGDSVVPLRAGSIHSDSLKALLDGKLRVPAGFEDLPTSTVVDLAAVRRNRHYLR